MMDALKWVVGILALIFLALLLCGVTDEPVVEPDKTEIMAQVIASQVYEDILERTGSYSEAERCYIVAYEEAMADG